MIKNGEIRGPLIGCDIYHGNMPFSRYFGDFQIHKATEGKTFVDCDYLKWCDERSSMGGTLNGAYHFMSTSTDIRKQANNFITTVKTGWLKTVPILDCEGDALDAAVKAPSMIKTWMDIVEKEFEVTPWLYTNTDGCNRLPLEILRAYPIWIASYGKKIPNMGKLESYRWICWQFVTNPWDMDIFNGTVEDWVDSVCRFNVK